MNTKFVSYRRDIVSYTSYPMDKLLCFKIDDNSIIYDRERNIKGRSFYIYKDKNSIEIFKTNAKFKKYQKLNNFLQEVEKAYKDVE